MKKGITFSSFFGFILSGILSLDATTRSDDSQVEPNQNLNLQGIQPIPDRILFCHLYDLEKCDCDQLYRISKISESMNDSVIYHLQSRVSDLRVNIYGRTDLKLLSTSIFAKSITHLNMNCFRNGSNDLISIIFQSFPKLKSLSLHKCNIDDNGADILADILRENGTLESLDLSENMIGDQGVLYIKNTMYENTALKILDLSYNNISCISVFYDALKYNSTLQALILSTNRIQPEYLKEIQTKFGHRVLFVERIPYSGGSLRFQPK